MSYSNLIIHNKIIRMSVSPNTNGSTFFYFLKKPHKISQRLPKYSQINGFDVNDICPKSCQIWTSDKWKNKPEKQENKSLHEKEKDGQYEDQ
jgi:hypothetical protein